MSLLVGCQESHVASKSSIIIQNVQESMCYLTVQADVIINFHIGEIVTSLQRATLIPGGSESLVYTTLSGAVGMLVPFTSHEVMYYSQWNRFVECVMSTSSAACSYLSTWQHYILNIDYDSLYYCIKLYSYEKYTGFFILFELDCRHLFQCRLNAVFSRIILLNVLSPDGQNASLFLLLFNFRIMTSSNISRCTCDQSCHLCVAVIISPSAHTTFLFG